jgi:2-hydroxy-6-oxo-6-(2'-aminophenyl)hexa-2,4-dienoate hydrolase
MTIRQGRTVAINAGNSVEAHRPPSQYLDAGGILTHFVEMGEGVPTILIHGGGAGADCWGNWRACLPIFAKQCRAIAIDLVGFGRSDVPDPATFTYSQDARDRQLADFVLALDYPGKVNLVGNSTGGLTAIGAAQLIPDKVDRVILMGSAGIETGIITPLKALTEYDFTEAGIRRIIDSLANPNFKPGDDLIRYRHQLSIDPDVRKGYSAFMSWMKSEGGLHRPESFIAKLKHPALVLHGKQDAVVPLSSAYRMLELIENSWGYIMPHCGHWAMLEYPEAFSAASLAFLYR